MINNRMANWNDVPDIFQLISENQTEEINQGAFEEIMRMLLYHPRFFNVIMKKNNVVMAFFSIEKKHIINLYQTSNRVISELFAKSIDEETKLNLKNTFTKMLEENLA